MDIDQIRALSLIGFAALLYVAAARVMRRRPTRAQSAFFAAGLLTLAIALVGPLANLTDHRFFAAYIFQQILLAMVAPPLILMGTPDWMVRPILTRRTVEPIWRFLTNPVAAVVIFSGAFALIHYPPVCDRVCHARPFYGGIRVLLLTVGTLLWWPLLSPLKEFRRLSYPYQILYLFLLMIPMTAVAAPITLSDSVLYVYYLAGPHPWGIAPMTDQVIGGLLMWVGQALYVIAFASVVFYRWSRSEDGGARGVQSDAAGKVRRLSIASSRPGA